MTEHKPRISSATLSHRSLDPSQDPNCTDEQLPGAVDPMKKQDVTKQPINTMPDNGKPIQTQAQQDIADVSRQSPNLSLRQQPEGDSEPEIIAAPALSVQPPGAEELADQTEIEMPKESVEPVEDVYENANPQDYGIDYEPEDVDYEPPDEGNKDLPDLNNLLQSLDTDSPQNDQDAPVAPPVETPEAPSLFMVPEHVTNYQKIAGLRMQLEEEEVDPYIDDFDAGARDDLLMIGNISLEEVQEEERRLRDEHIAYREQEAMKEHRKQQMIIQQTEHGKKSVAMRLKEKRKELQIRKRLLQERERAVMDRIHKAFRRSEHQLVNILEDRKGEVQTMYGDLMEVEGMYGGSKGRRWKVDWEKTPQPVQIKLKVMRGVKDKVPGGRYIMMVSLYNHLGGNLLRWSKLKAQRWGGTTLPLVHEGNFFNNELKVDHSVFTVLPSKPDIRPGMVIVFELFLLRGAAVSSDKVVGWGAFPITDGGFDVVEGKFKCPMLYGEMDPEITKHEKIEGLIASNIDHWLCNLYFEIVKLPRYLGNQKEHEVELQFSSMLLNYPDRLHPGEEYRDGEVPVYGSLSDVKSLPTESNMGSQLSTRTENLLESTPSLNGSQNSLHRRRLSAVSQSTSLPTDETTPPGYKQSSSGFDNIYNGKLRRTKSFRPPVTHAGSRYLIEKKKVKYGDDSDSTDCENEEDLYVKKKDRYAPVNGKPGMYYKRYKHNPVDEYHQQLFTLLPKTEALKQAKPKRPQGYLEELEEHSFSVHNPTAERGHEGDEGWEKMRYISRQFAAELGLSQWRSSGFWTILFLFCFLFFVRMYLHYVAQWGYLQMLEMPINKFDFLPYTVTLNYQPSLLSARQEVAVVMLGPIINIIFFTILVILSWLMQRLLGFYPDIGSKFNVVYGIHAFLDPILILIVDSALERYQYKGGDFPIADYAKLYYNFDREQGSGLAGIFITIFVYMFTMFLAGAILYMYFLRLHNNGRMLDIFWRLHGDADIFFVPYDLEMSNQELSWIIKKSEQWRGEEGERRKTAVYDYIWEEETVEETEWEETSSQKRNARSGKKEITTHVSIHTVHLDGLKELYRQFLRLPDGAIVEVFGDLTMPGMNKDIGKALNTGVKKMENLEEVDETKAEVGECSSGGDVSENQPQHTADGKAEHSIP